MPFENTSPPMTPRHVAIIMDGNGRWASRRRLPRVAGHRKGVEALREIVRACPDFGVETLTLFAFSTENWRRPADEVSALMGLFRRYMRRESAELEREGVRVRFIGDRRRLDADIVAMMEGLETRTAENRNLTVIIALNYGGRDEIVRAAARLAAAAARGEVDPAGIDEAAFAGALDTAGESDPDLLIRTSGEQRLSGFLPWQCTYSELHFAEALWPDFTRDTFAKALASYGTRERRFGAVAG